MKLIDEELGEITPLNVIIKFPKEKDDDGDDDWGNNEKDESKYLFTRIK